MLRVLFVCFLVSWSATVAAKDWQSFEQFAQAKLAGVATQADLLALLRNPDPYELEFAIRFSANACNSPLDALPVYEAIWTSESSRYPSLDHDYLSQPILRLAVASALAQLEGGHREELRAYVLERLQERSESTLTYAIVALGYVGTRQDIEQLIDLAKYQDGEYLSAAAWSMRALDPDDARQAYRALGDYFGSSTWQSKSLERMLERN